jgi:hypothetical protein
MKEVYDRLKEAFPGWEIRLFLHADGRATAQLVRNQADNGGSAGFSAHGTLEEVEKSVMETGRTCGIIHG